MLNETLKKDFKYVDRGYKDLIVLIPGWATDYRIFENLDLKFNYLFPLNFDPRSFKSSLCEVIRNNEINNISILGFSLGANLAVTFASEFNTLIDKVILVGMRQKYEKVNLDVIRNFLKQNKSAYLYKFYSQCFYNGKARQNFKELFVKDYCRKFSLDYLIATLDFLERCEIDKEKLKDLKNVKIIHGEYDRIAPFKEILNMKDKFRGIEFIFAEKCGHMCFLEKDLGIYDL